MDQAGELTDFGGYCRGLELGVLTFPGYLVEALPEGADALLAQTDLFIDGPFMRNLLDYSRPLVGSSNQRFICLTDRISKEEMGACANRVEVRVTPQWRNSFQRHGQPAVSSQVPGREKAMSTKDFSQDFANLSSEGFPYLYIPTYEEERVVQTISVVIGTSGLVRTPRRLFQWSQTDGLVGEERIISVTTNPLLALNAIANSKEKFAVPS